MDITLTDRHRPNDNRRLGQNINSIESVIKFPAERYT
jgi:hypothetical protein